MKNVIKLTLISARTFISSSITLCSKYKLYVDLAVLRSWLSEKTKQTRRFFFILRLGKSVFLFLSSLSTFIVLRQPIIPLFLSAAVVSCAPAFTSKALFLSSELAVSRYFHVQYYIGKIKKKEARTTRQASH